MIPSEKLESFVNHFWDNEILPTLKEYVAIPNKSPNFDPDWEKHGYMAKALELVRSWLEQHPIEGSQVYIDKIAGRTPALFIEVPGEIDKNVLMYGHLDKQPEMEGWREGLGPWTPVLESEKLYGRGGADDGYAIFSAVCALNALKKCNLKHPRVVIIIEFSEESGSVDLPAYVEKYSTLIGKPDLIICLDSTVGNYDQFWVTTSLRGAVSVKLKVEVLTEGVHSGMASGIIPSSYRILNQLIARIENLETGNIYPKELQVTIPQDRIDQAKEAASVLGKDIFHLFPITSDLTPMRLDLTELLLNRSWHAALSFVGIDGVPSTVDGGNVLLPYTRVKLSLRLPPTIDVNQAKEFLRKTLTTDIPYNAKVTAEFSNGANGWNAPAFNSHLSELLNHVSQIYFKKPAVALGEGGSIPFMGMLGQMFPKAQFVITGVLGPMSNAHGPNEFLHIPYVKKLTACIAHILTKFN